MIEIAQEQLLSLQNDSQLDSSPTDGTNSLSNLSTLLSSYFKARSSIISQIDANNQRIQDIQHLRNQFASFPQSALPSDQNYIQEISRLQRMQGIQESVCPSTNLYPQFMAEKNLNNRRISMNSPQEWSELNLSRSSHQHIQQTEARGAFNIAFLEHAYSKAQQQQ